MKQKHLRLVLPRIMTVLLLAGFSAVAIADQVIYVDIAHFSPSDSQFGVDVKGNRWVKDLINGALGGDAYGGPGDNNHANDAGEPYLVIKVPTNVLPGEGTSNGKTWAAWARLYEPASLTSPTDFNSFFLRTSRDKNAWTPANRGDTSLRFNDPGATFPASVNGAMVLLTDVGNAAPWFWEHHRTNGQSTIDPVLESGVNYIEVGIRESDLVNFPRIDIICLRNDGGLPSDREALGSGTAVEPAGKLATLWGRMKAGY